MVYGVDLKYLKKSIHDFLQENGELFRGAVLDVGCGDMPYKSSILTSFPGVEKYLGLDLENNYCERNAKPDIIWDGTKIPLPDNSIDCAFATEVLEHCPEPRQTLCEVYRVLRPGGVFLFTVPFLWPLHEVPYDFYRFTPFSLRMLLEDTGFSESNIEMLGGWDASLAQILGLWLVRRPNMSSRKRWLLTRLLTPLIDYLQKIDEKTNVFNESQMCTGLCGVSYKTHNSR